MVNRYVYEEEPAVQKIIIAIIAFCTLFAGCGGDFVVINPAYSGKTIAFGKLAIVFAPKFAENFKSINKISPPQNYDPDLGGPYEGFEISERLKAKLCESLKFATGMSAVYSDYLSGLDYYETAFIDTSDTSIGVYPLNGTGVKLRNTNSDYILLFQNSSSNEVKIKEVKVSANVFQMVSVEDQTYLYLNTSFFLWDVKNKQYIAYGRIGSDMSTKGNDGPPNVDDLCNIYVDILLSYLPF